MNNHCDQQYVCLLRRLLGEGERIRTRNADVRRVMWPRIEFKGTPLIGVRKTAWRNGLREWEWFMSGSNRIDDLHPSVRHWWEPWVDECGVIPYNYSEQFRRMTMVDPDTGHVGSFDQIKYLTDGLRGHVNSRRNVIGTWYTPEMAHPSCPITNCHGTVIQALVDSVNRLHLFMFQRSADVICGLPVNFIQYYSFLLWLAGNSSRGVGNLTWTGGDVHLYEEHVPLAERIVAAADQVQPTPALVYHGKSRDAEYRADDFELSGEYRPVLVEKARMVV